MSANDLALRFSSAPAEALIGVLPVLEVKEALREEVESDVMDEVWMIEAAHALREQGIAHVVISLGEEGALWVNASGEWIAKPPSVEVVSTVGAGDSMVGGLIYGLLMRESSEHTLRLATAVAALAVSQSNVGITDRTQLAAMMARVDLQPFN